MEQPPTHEHSPGLSSVVERNIRKLVERRELERHRQSRHERIAARVAAFAGSIAFVYLHLLLFGAWILLNVGWLPVPRFDPSFVILAMFASVEAIFLSTFVLITQNRMGAEAEKRAELDLQISMLAEHEITRLISLVNALVKHAGIEIPQDKQIEELQQDIAPEKVLDRIEGR